MTHTPLVIRADASVEIGTGHVMRCLALAQAWQDTGGSVTFCCAGLPISLKERLIAEGCSVRLLDVTAGTESDAWATLKIAEEIGAEWIVIDGYIFGASYQKWIKDGKKRLLFIDDNGHAKHYYADIVLNQNIHADAGLYKNRGSETRLLLGTKFVLLRKEFWPWRGYRRQIAPVVRNVLVTMGGSDPENLTGKLIHALNDMSQWTITVVIGGVNPRYSELSSGARHIRLVRNIVNMPMLLAQSDVSITAAGSTCWEMAFMSLPMLTIIAAKNQEFIANTLHKKGVAQNLGWYNEITFSDILQSIELDLKSRTSMSELGQNLIDSFGGQRVCKAILITKASYDKLDICDL